MATKVKKTDRSAARNRTGGRIPGKGTADVAPGLAGPGASSMAGLSAREMMVIAACFAYGKKGATIRQMVPICVVFEHWAKLSAPVRKRALAFLSSPKWMKRFQKGAKKS